MTQVKRISSWRIVFVSSKTCTACCKGPPCRIFTVDCTYTGFVNACLSEVKSTLIFFISKIQIMMELYLCGSSLAILLFFFLPRFSPSTRFLFKLIIIYSRSLTLWISSEKVLDSDRDEVVARGEFENFVNFLRRLLAVFDNNSDCKGRNS